MHKAFVYRLYPTAKQAEQLTWILDRCRELYNAALQERRDAYRMAGQSLGYCDQAGELPGLKEACPEYKQVGSQVLQNVLKRAEHAFAAFFRRVKAGQRPGYPRFKGRDRYDSFTYTQAGWKLQDNRLVLRGIGSIKVKLHRAVQSTIKTVALKLSSLSPARPGVGKGHKWAGTEPSGERSLRSPRAVAVGVVTSS